MGGRRVKSMCFDLLLGFLLVVDLLYPRLKVTPPFKAAFSTGFPPDSGHPSLSYHVNSRGGNASAILSLGYCRVL